MKNNCRDKFDNTAKGMIMEKAFSQASWNNELLHNHNCWDNRANYVWGDGPDHYILELKMTVECKNPAEKTSNNFSKAWLYKEILRRGQIDVVVTTFELKPENEEYLFSNGVRHIITVGFQVNPENYDRAVEILTEKIGRLKNKTSNTQSIEPKNLAEHNISRNNNVGVCNSSFIVSYFMGYLVFNSVFDSVVNVFYMIIDDKPKINDPPDNKNNKIIDVCVSETNNKSNIVQSKTNSDNKFYLTLNANKITSKIKNHLKKTNHRLINCLNKIANKLNPNLLLPKTRFLLPFRSFG